MMEQHAAAMVTKTTMTKVTPPPSQRIDVADTQYSTSNNARVAIVELKQRKAELSKVPTAHR